MFRDFDLFQPNLASSVSRLAGWVRRIAERSTLLIIQKGPNTMKSRITILTLACAAALLIGTTAQAADITFQESVLENSVYKWSKTGNWDLGRLPTTGDHVIIPTTRTATIYAADADGVADTISVVGTLDIQAGRVLTLSNDATPSNSSVDGTINLQGSASTLRFVAANHSVSGDGAIVGLHDAARIEIGEVDSSTPVVFTNSATIRGQLVIADVTSESGSFSNQGTVNANVDGVLLITVSTVSDAAGSDRWMSTDADAVLEFSDQIGSFGTMAGEFVLSAGVIEFNKELTGSAARHLTMSGGTLTVNQDLEMGNNSTAFAEITGGTIDVAAGMTFIHE